MTESALPATIDLAQQPFLKGLKPEYLEQITECAFMMHLPKGHYLFDEGEPANRFYIITHGNVCLNLHVPARGEICIETVAPDEVIGWSWFLPPYRWHFAARAMEDTELIAFDARCLRGKCDDNHDLGYELVMRFAQVLMQRLQATRLQMLDIYGATTEQLPG